MDELSLYFSTENETSKTKLGGKLTKSFSIPNRFHNDSQQRKSFRDCTKKNKTMDSGVDSNHPFCKLSAAPNNKNVSTKMPYMLPPEVEEGNIEYKRKLVDPTPNRFEQLVTQMKWRLNEGGGKAIYKLGVDDDGHISGLRPTELISSLTTLERMAKRLNATLHPLRERIIEPTEISSDKEYRKAVELLVRLAPTTNEGSPDMCIALVGGMDSGKSTLISVLTDGELDNARGKARLNLFRHLHEVQSGRTSSLSRELLGFDANGNVTNYKYADGRVYRRSAEEVIRMSSNLLTLIDLAGHSKYQRTTLSGIACNQPVMGILVISATIGLSTIGLEHIQLIRSLNLPMIVVLTKIDQLSNVYQFKQIENAWSYGMLSTLNKSSMNEKFSALDGWLLNSTRDSHGNTCMPPFFPVSSVTGQGIDNLIQFLSRLSCLNHPINELSLQSELSSVNFNQKSTVKYHQQTKLQQTINLTDFSNQNQITLILNKIREQMKIVKTYRDFNGTLFWINQVFTQIPGVSNPVLVGRVQLGQLLNNQILWLGPDHFGDFCPVQIVSLMHNRQVHDIVYAGQSASMEVNFLPKSWNSLTHQERINILQNISSSYHSLDQKRSQFLLFSNDNDTGNEENIPYNNYNHKKISNHGVHDDNHNHNNNEEKEKTTNRSDMYQFSSPIKLRRGMILLTYPMLMNSHLSTYVLSSSTIDSPSSSSSSSPNQSSSPSIGESFIWNQHLKSKHQINFTVVWTVKLQLIHRLPIVSFKLGTPPIILTPIPPVGQRVTIYAGCICQTGVILDSSIEEHHHHHQRRQKQNDKEHNHLTETTHIYVRFTRHPEWIELGRQFILTWNGNLKTIGYAVGLIDPLNHNNTILPHPPPPTTTTNNNNKIVNGDDIKDSVHSNTVNNYFCRNTRNTLSFHEKDDYDWSSLRMSFINRMNSSEIENHYGSIGNLPLLLSSSSMEFYTNYTKKSMNEQFNLNHDTSTMLNLTTLPEIENQDSTIQKSKTNNDVVKYTDITSSIVTVESNSNQLTNDISINNNNKQLSQSTNYHKSLSSNKRRHRRKQKR
ncbi:unnamed protein product [Heterobilharzia americana]|nr:unnamed protein product [Heterobilharzia americana]